MGSVLELSAFKDQIWHEKCTDQRLLRNDYLPIIAQVAAQPTVLLMRMENITHFAELLKAEGFQQG